MREIRPAQIRRRRVSALEQSELWPSERRRELPVVESRSAVPVAPSAAVEPVKPRKIETAPAVRTPVRETRTAEPVQARRPRRRIMAPVTQEVSAPQSRSARVNTIARFLNVNGMIDLPKTNSLYFDFPGRGHFQSLHLWSGSPEQQEFTPGQF